MPSTPHHLEVEQRFRALIDAAGLDAPEEVAHLERALVFVWYEPKSLILVDLDELADGDWDAPDDLSGFVRAA